MEPNAETIDCAAQAIVKRVSGPFPKTAVILGSGLGGIADRLSEAQTVSYGDIPGFPVSTVAGHEGRLVAGKLNGAALACMQGRMHVYEGYAPRHLAVSIRTLRKLGVERLLITNAAGSLRRAMGPGSLMIIDDHINFSGYNPLIGPNKDDVGPRFPDMSEAYDPDLRAALRRAAIEAGVEIHSGVYLFTAGPNFETPAEIRMFATMGADAVGMSTVPECLVARHAGMRVVGLSLISNLAAGLSPVPLSHEEVFDEAAKAFDKVSRLFERFFPVIG